MSDQKPNTPPYVPYRTFLNFIDSTLKENGVPNRIDLSLFGTRPSGTAYATLAALKFLELVNDEGHPSDDLRKLASAGDQERKEVTANILKRSYPGLFADGFDLTQATAGQFDEYFRETYGISGSTVDKVAGFFIAAADDGEVPISAHIRSRKRIAGTGQKRPRKAKKKDHAGDKEGSGESSDTPSNEDTGGGGLGNERPEIVLLNMIDMAEMNTEEQQAVWTLIQYLKRKEAGLTKKAGHGGSG